MHTKEENRNYNYKRFEAITKGINAGIYEANLQNNSCWFSSEIQQMLGLNCKEKTLNCLLDQIISKDKAKFLDLIEQSKKQEESFVFDTQILTSSGIYQWFRLTGQSTWKNEQPHLLNGFIRNIDAQVKSELENKRNEFLLEEAGYMAKVGGWELILGQPYVMWSKEVCLIHEVPIDYKPKLEDAISFYSPDYAPIIEDAVNQTLNQGTPFDLELKIITANKREIWVRAIGKPVYELNSNKIIGIRGVFQDIDEQKMFIEKVQKNEALLEVTGQMAKIGGWEVDYRTMKGTWSKQVSLIHEMPPSYQPSLEEAIQFVHPDFIPKIQEVMTLLMTDGRPFDEELKIITARKREVWVRAMGIPVYDSQTGKVIIARGVFQDIDEQKHKEQALQASVRLIDDQNKRLLDFAHIISHNLRSHSANMELTLSLMEGETDSAEIQHSIQNLSKISRSFKQTLAHLSDIMDTQINTDILKVPVKFETVLGVVTATLKTEIELSGAVIQSNFSQCEEIKYVPAYLESILLNLLSNAIKYRRPDVKPQISISTLIDKGKVVLQVSDNGQGIDLEKYGHRLFGMYKTFHKHPDSKGIGLYITRNQIESQGGKISVQSRVNEGSTFIVNF